MKGYGWFWFIVAGWAILIFQSSFYGDPDDWFVVSDLHVADVAAGHDAVVNYDRTIKQDFRGTWTVEVNEVTDDGFVAACTGVGGANYKRNDIKPVVYLLSRFVGKDCVLTTGKQYSVNAVWTLRPIGIPPMEVERTSNVFTMLPPE